MKLTENSWPPDLDPKQHPQYPEMLINLANRHRSRARFWLSPVGVLIIGVILVATWILQQLFNK